MDRYVQPEGAAVRWTESCPCAAPSAEGIGVEVGTIEGRELRPAPVSDERAPLGVAVGRVALLAFEPQLGEPSQPRVSLARVAERIARRLPFGEWVEPPARLGGPGGVIATLQPGATLTVHTDWRALADVPEDYAVTLQLLHHRQHMIAQDDEWPRRGFSPTSLWHTGQQTESWYTLRVPAEATPGKYRLVLGMYARRDMKRVAWTTPGRLSDWFELGYVKIPAPAAGGPASGPVFGGVIRLADVGVERRGAELVVRPKWVVEGAPGREYTVFVHVVDADGQPVSQGDSPPLGGAYPTSLWEPGEEIDDEYVLPAGNGRVLIGLYRPDTGERLRTGDGADSVEIGRW